MPVRWFHLPIAEAEARRADMEARHKGDGGGELSVTEGPDGTCLVKVRGADKDWRVSSGIEDVSIRVYDRDNHAEAVPLVVAWDQEES